MRLFVSVALLVSLAGCEEEKCHCNDAGVAECNKEESGKYDDDKVKAAVKAVRNDLIYVIDKRHQRPVCLAVLVHSNGSIASITSTMCENLDPQKRIPVEYPYVGQ